MKRIVFYDVRSPETKETAEEELLIMQRDYGYNERSRIEIGPHVVIIMEKAWPIEITPKGMRFISELPDAS